MLEEIRQLTAALSPAAGASGVEALGLRIDELRRAVTANQETIASNTESLREAPRVQPQEGGVAKTAGSILKGAGGFFNPISPILSGLGKLFGGDGGSRTAEHLPAFALPEPLQVHAALTADRQIEHLRYAQGGAPEAVAPRAASQPQVTVNIQAMDSRSFLDRRDDIASAVRDAMLHSHSLNDVVADV